MAESVSKGLPDPAGVEAQSGQRLAELGVRLEAFIDLSRRISDMHFRDVDDGVRKMAEAFADAKSEAEREEMHAHIRASLESAVPIPDIVLIEIIDNPRTTDPRLVSILNVKLNLVNTLVGMIDACADACAENMGSLEPFLQRHLKPVAQRINEMGGIVGVVLVPMNLFTVMSKGVRLKMQRGNVQAYLHEFIPLTWLTDPSFASDLQQLHHVPVDGPGDEKHGSVDDHTSWN